MSNEQRSKIEERKAGIMTIEGYDTFYLEPKRAVFDFVVKSRPDLRLCPFILESRCHDLAELTEATARAFANYILKQCDKIKDAK